MSQTSLRNSQPVKPYKLNARS